MSKPLLLTLTCTNLGLYRLDICPSAQDVGEALDDVALATAEALCAAVNTGVADEAVFQALNARFDAAVFDSPVPGDPDAADDAGAVGHGGGALAAPPIGAA